LARLISVYTKDERVLATNTPTRSSLIRRSSASAWNHSSRKEMFMQWEKVGKFLVAGVLVVSMSGCAGFMDKAKKIAQAPCPYMADVKIAKDKIKVALTSAQVGYDLVVGMAGVADKVPSGQMILANVAVIDAVLDKLGKLYYDTICPTEAEVLTAEMAAAEAQAAQAELGIVHE